MADVFISYKREEIAWAARVAQALSEEGFSAFYDLDDDGIHAGEEWDKRLEQELAAAKCCVVLWSRASTESANVRSEARRASTLGILVPAKINACQAPIGLDILQEADLTQWRGDRTDVQWRFLVDRGVARKVGRAGRPPKPAAALLPPQHRPLSEQEAAGPLGLPKWLFPAGAAGLVLFALLIWSPWSITTLPPQLISGATVPPHAKGGADVDPLDAPTAPDARIAPPNTRQPENEENASAVPPKRVETAADNEARVQWGLSRQQQLTPATAARQIVGRWNSGPHIYANAKRICTGVVFNIAFDDGKVQVSRSEPIRDELVISRTAFFDPQSLVDITDGWLITTAPSGDVYRYQRARGLLRYHPPNDEPVTLERCEPLTNSGG